MKLTVILTADESSAYLANVGDAVPATVTGDEGSPNAIESDAGRPSGLCPSRRVDGRGYRGTSSSCSYCCSGWCLSRGDAHLCLA